MLTFLLTACSSSTQAAEPEPEPSGATEAATVAPEASPSPAPDFDDGGAELDSSAWQVEISRAYENTTSDFVRTVLADGVITRAEMREANYHHAACLRDAGFEAEPVEEDGRLMVWSPFHNVLDDGDWDWWDTPARVDCAYLWWGGNEGLGFLWQLMLVDPGNEGPSATMVACLIRQGQAPEDLTVALWEEITGQAALAEYWAQYDEFFADLTIGEQSVIIQAQPDTIEVPYLPGWGLVGEDEAIRIGCSINPHL